MIIVTILLGITFWYLSEIACAEGRMFWSHVYLFLSALNGALAMSVVF
jgi:hypothetical protein